MEATLSSNDRIINDDVYTVIYSVDLFLLKWTDETYQLNSLPSILYIMYLFVTCLWMMTKFSFSICSPQDLMERKNWMYVLHAIL